MNLDSRIVVGRFHYAERSPPCLHCDRPVRSSIDMLEEKRLQSQLKKMVKEEKELEHTLRTRGALKSAYGSPSQSSLMGRSSSLASSLSASRASL